MNKNKYEQNYKHEYEPLLRTETANTNTKSQWTSPWIMIKNKHYKNKRNANYIVNENKKSWNRIEESP